MNHADLLSGIDEECGLTNGQKIRIDNLIYQYEKDLQSATISASTAKLAEIVKLGFELGMGRA